MSHDHFVRFKQMIQCNTKDLTELINLIEIWT